MPTGYDEQVSGRQWLDVQECQRPFAFVDHAGLGVAGDDPTEDAFRRCHHAQDPTAAAAKRFITGVRERALTRAGYGAERIIPAATVSFVASSIRMNAPVVRFSA